MLDQSYPNRKVTFYLNQKSGDLYTVYEGHRRQKWLFIYKWQFKEIITGFSQIVLKYNEIFEHNSCIWIIYT